ncbi:MAG: hypothetical protein M1834_008874 [Cirrosporium novae-zelandiae]|nr:MAG: hypothetical protein M1834_008874 [Cirrosporium novae-zelandiae]
MSFASILRAISLIAVIRLSFGIPTPLPSTQRHTSRAINGTESLGAVSCESETCSQIGTTLLKEGGSAADALVGTVLCVGVIGSYHSGIGGGGFGLVRDANGSYEFVDFRERAPAAAFEDMYNNDTDLSLYGGLASGVPGELRGLEHIHKKHGLLPWSKVVQPAIDLARDGFRVTEDTVHYMASATDDDNFLVNDPTWAIDFAPNGTLLGLGDTLTRKRHANTLERIAQHGADAFYSGWIANATIAALQAANGTMVLADLANYTVAIREPLQIEYRGYKITAASAPSSGTVVLSVFKAVEGYSGFGEPATLNLSTHRLDEATKFGYGQRMMLGDPYFASGMDVYQHEMINETTAAATRAKISNYHTLNTSAYDPDGLITPQTHGTSGISATDSTGLSISLTTTVNTLFGSRVMVPETGVIMNNEMNDFSIPGESNTYGYVATEINYIRPFKRPLSSISPVIVEHLNTSDFYFVAAGAGGSRIITATIQSLWNVLDRNMTTAEALAEPRFHDQLIPNRMQLEWAYDNGTAAYLTALGHNITWVEEASSDIFAIRKLASGIFEAAAEPRQDNSGGSVV